MLTAEEAARAIAPLIGYAPSREQIAVAFLDVDQVAIAAAVDRRVRWERWDRQSPINGVPAETVLASRTDYQGGEIYVVYVDDALVYFQPADPTDGSMVTEQTLAAVADAQVASIEGEMIRTDLLAAIIKHLPVFAPAPQVAAAPQTPPSSPPALFGPATGPLSLPGFMLPGSPPSG